MSDADMCQHSRTKRQHFIDNKPDFVAFDADFDGTFDADWLAAIEAAEGVEDDETRDDVLQQESEDVAVEMKNARKKVAEVEYFANKAFGTDKKVLAELGIGEVSAANTTQLMVRFLTKMHSLVNGKYQANFLGVNYSLLKIAEIETVKNALATENTEQDSFAEKSPKATGFRIGTLNAGFAFWQKVNAASKSIYYDDPVNLNLYLFPRGTEAPEVIKVQGTARHSVTNAVLAGVLVSMPAVGVSGVAVITDSNGQFVIAGVDGGIYDILFSKTGFQNYSQLGITVPLDGSVVVDVMMVPL
jgi:hypothetical protein